MIVTALSKPLNLLENSLSASMFLSKDSWSFSIFSTAFSNCPLFLTVIEQCKS